MHLSHLDSAPEVDDVRRGHDGKAVVEVRGVAYVRVDPGDVSPLAIRIDSFETSLKVLAAKLHVRSPASEVELRELIEAWVLLRRDMGHPKPEQARRPSNGSAPHHAKKGGRPGRSPIPVEPADAAWHGTRTGYVKHRCGCGPCHAAGVRLRQSDPV